MVNLQHILFTICKLQYYLQLQYLILDPLVNNTALSVAALSITKLRITLTLSSVYNDHIAN